MFTRHEITIKLNLNSKTVVCEGIKTPRRYNKEKEINMIEARED